MSQPRPSRASGWVLRCQVLRCEYCIRNDAAIKATVILRSLRRRISPLDDVGTPGVLALC